MNSSCRAIVLKSIDFKESSKIVTVLSKEYGKFALIARGAKKPKSKFAGSLQLGDIVDLTYSYKSTRGLQTLTEADTQTRTYAVQQDFQKLGLLMRTLEMADILSEEHEEVPELFEFLAHFIPWLVKTSLAVDHLFPYVQTRFADLMGLRLQIEEEMNVETDVFINMDQGLLSNTSSSGLSYRLTEEQTTYLLLSISRKGKALTRLEISAREIQELTVHMDVYFKHHLDSVRDRKSDAIFNILNG